MTKNKEAIHEFFGAFSKFGGIRDFLNFLLERFITSSTETGAGDDASKTRSFFSVQIKFPLPQASHPLTRKISSVSSLRVSCSRTNIEYFQERKIDYPSPWWG